MRPVLLKLKSFTAFRDEQTLDFEPLDVFAIAGPTGSGKSSLLDALTYALFGTVDRVGKQVGQLISQGQPRMSVVLEFEVDGKRYRIARSTPAKGATTILLERADGDGWQTYGEGADRVKGANAHIKRLIGLDYTAFTRSVLLPQGKFAEFLTGESKDRRDILTELLGLALFRRLAERAGSIAKDAAIRADADQQNLVREYGDATPEALTGLKAKAKEVRAREVALAKAEAKVAAAARSWEEAERAVRDLSSCAEEARAMASMAAEAEAATNDLAEKAREASGALAEQRALAEAAAKEAGRRTDERAAAEALWGREAELAAAREQALSLERLGAGRDDARGRAQAAAPLVPMREAEVEAAERVRAEATVGRDEAERARDLAVNAVDDARHADLVAAVSAGLKAGDPCPVCGEPLRKAPPRTAAAAAVLKKAEKTLSAAQASVEKHSEIVAARNRDRDRALAALERAGADLERATGEAARAEAEVVAATDRLAKAFGGGEVPPEPIRALEERVAQLKELAAAEAAAAALTHDHEKSAALAERAMSAMAAEVARYVSGLEAQPVAALVARARAVGATTIAAKGMAFESPPDPGDADAVAVASGRFEALLNDLAVELEEAAVKRSAAEASFLAEAEAAVGDLVPSPGTLTGMAETVTAACRQAAVDAATAQNDAERIAAKIESRAALAQEIAGLQARALTFKALAMELRADRIVAFLQAEALQVLAAAGSDRLTKLSDGRYRLVCQDDEFTVVDTWNGEERRSVRTLSGGETFLASLALALALSEQVRSLSVTRRARLDSLFLDEGFGTLDPESLQVVVEAVEQLGGDGRLVGVITHVRDLAEHFTRIEVTKSPRGSTLGLVS